MTGSGNIMLTSCHWEFNAATISGFPAEITNGGAAFMYKGGRILAANHTSWNPAVSHFISTNGFALFEGIRFCGLRPAVGFDTGDGLVQMDNNSYLGQSQMTGIRNRSCLADPEFQSGSLNSNQIFLISDTAAVTDRYAGSNINLGLSSYTSAGFAYAQANAALAPGEIRLATDSHRPYENATGGTLTPTASTAAGLVAAGLSLYTGASCLRVRKTGGSGSTASFLIATPCVSGDIFFREISLLNNDNRSGQVGLGSMWMRLDGFSNGVPQIYTQQLQAFNVQPGASWASYATGSTLNGSITQRAPDWATHFAILVRMNAWTGGSSGASEDGGNYSLYFDKIGMYRWH